MAIFWLWLLLLPGCLSRSDDHKLNMMFKVGFLCIVENALWILFAANCTANHAKVLLLKLQEMAPNEYSISTISLCNTMVWMQYIDILLCNLPTETFDCCNRLPLSFFFRRVILWCLYTERQPKKNPRWPHTTGPKPHQLKTPAPKTLFKTPTPKHHKWAKMRTNEY